METFEVVASVVAKGRINSLFDQIVNDCECAVEVAITTGPFDVFVRLSGEEQDVRQDLAELTRWPSVEYLATHLVVEFFNQPSTLVNTESLYAYTTIDTKPNEANYVAQQLSRLDGNVESVWVDSSRDKVIARIGVERLQDIGALVTGRIHEINQITRSDTRLVQQGSIRLLPDQRSPAEVPHNLELVVPPWEEVYQFLARHPDHLHQMDPRKFEMLVAEIFKSYGWEVELTSQTKDGGFDIVALKSQKPNTLRVLVEAKRWAPDKPVGVGVVRALYGIRAANSASQVVLATSSYVSLAARKEFKRVIPWELDFLERDTILRWCKEQAGIPVLEDWSP